MECVDLAQDKEKSQAPANVSMNFLVAYNAGNCMLIRGPVNFSRRALFREISQTILTNGFTAFSLPLWLKLT
jgi:hypothetical protein